MRLSDTTYALHQRQISLLMSQYHLRYLHRLSVVFEGDIDLALILGEVAHRNVTAVAKANTEAGGTVDRALIRARQEGKYLPCSAMSVSLVTGLPRETVRRKLAKLVKDGFVEQVGKRGYVITTKPLEYFGEILNKPLTVDFLETAAKIRALLEA